MKKSGISRRKFISATSTLAASSTCFGINSVIPLINSSAQQKEKVSIVKIKNGNIAHAVEEAIDLLGGIESLTHKKERILIKPNLVTDSPHCTTNIHVVKTLGRIMKMAGKEVVIGEASAAASAFNVFDGETFKTRKKNILDKMQQHIFDVLGYTAMADSLEIPLVNLHSGDMVEIQLEKGFVSDSIIVHKAVAESDLICSVPMMKTHVLSTITLSMKNLVGLYPGTKYYSVRSWLHDRAYEAGSPGIAYEVLDMNAAVPAGLSVIDASTAMEGNGPAEGTLVEMGLIVAGTSPLATDMVGALLMGFELNEIPAIALAHKAGMHPLLIESIEVRGMQPEQCCRRFTRPAIYKWSDINELWGAKEI